MQGLNQFILKTSSIYSEAGNPEVVVYLAQAGLLRATITSQKKARRSGPYGRGLNYYWAPVLAFADAGVTVRLA